METVEQLRERFNKTVVVDSEEEKQINAIMNPCREKLTEEMKKDKVFGKLFQEFYFGGSYYDKLAVGSNYDYDLNVVFGVPDEAFKVVQDNVDKRTDFMKFHVTDKLDANVSYVVDKDKISAVKMREVLHTAVDRALTRLKNTIILSNGGVVRITRSDSMAVTLHLQHENDNNNIIDLDLVATLRFPITKLPRGLQEEVAKVQEKVGSNVKDCFGVALKTGDTLQVDFPQLDRQIMSNKPALKRAVRLLKAERNEKGGSFNNVKSFMIKTVALHAAVSNPKHEYWQEKFFPTRYQELRKSLQNSLANNSLPSLFFPSVNLMDRIKNSQVKRDVGKYLEKKGCSDKS